MDYTDQQKEMFRRAYARNRHRQFALWVPALGIAILILGTQGGTVLGLPPAIGGPVSFLLVGAMLVYSLYNWRCPACDRNLGQAFNPMYCQRCGVQLRE